MAADGTSMPMGSASNLELMRQRAQKAAEFYQDQQKRQQQREKDRKGDITQRGQGQYADTYNNNSSGNHSSSGPNPADQGRGGNSNNISQVLSEESYDSVAPPSSNSFYRAKMRAGIIDMRSSYSERSGHNAGGGRMNSGMYHSQHTGPRVRTQTYALDNKQGYPHPPHSSSSSTTIASSSSSSSHQQQPAPQKPARTYATNRMLYRSSSDLEVDSGELDVPPPSSSNLHREYGSTSSLDILGTSTDNFFSMVSEFQHHNALDQRSPAPPRLQELLQGRLGANSEPQIPLGDSGKNSVKFLNGISQGGKDLGDDEVDGKTKTKTKHKDRKQRAKSITGEASASILKKLRGKTEADVPSSKSEERVGAGEETSSASIKSEDSCRKRAFVHFDCQSVGVDLSQVIQNRSAGLNYKNNTTTGASAASGQRLSLAPDKDDPDILADTDEGDGKSNDLVLSCPFFRNELGGEDERTVSLTRSTAHKRLSSGAIVTTTSTPTLSQSLPSQVRHPACCGVAILDSSPSPSGQILPPLVSHRGHVIEYVDHGAYYYRHFFYNYDHQNIFGIDENLGPVAISVRREKLDLDERTNNLGRAEYGMAQYRIICRTSELSTLRGCLLEEAIPARLSSSRGIPIKDVLEVAVPEVQISCLRQAVFGPKTCEQLLKLDEQGIGTTYKVGIMYCKAGQGSEEEMYNNETCGPALEEFLNLISSKVRLKGFEKYRGGLDCKTDTTGTHSYYTTFNNNEIMFHVSTMLPFTPNNKQQLLRKRHIGNDIVTVVFQEAGAQPFTPQTVRSQFQHVFIVVQVSNPNTDNTRYSVAITRSKDVPPFGPPIPEHCNFKKSQDFVDFVLAKIINSENAAHKSEKFRTMATRTRQEYLKDLATNYITSTPIDSGSKLNPDGDSSCWGAPHNIRYTIIPCKFGLGSGRKKEKVKQKVIPDMYAKGALVWEVQVEDMGTASQVECLLAVAADTIVLLEQASKDVIFTIPCSTLIGWTPQPSSLRLYFGAGECLLMRPFSGDVEEMHEIITRLQAVTNGIETTKMALKRNGLGQLGFHIQSEGIITDVEKYGYAWEAGLRKGSRLVEICKVATTTLSHDQIVDLLRTSAVVKVVVVPPMDDGSPRGFVTHSSHISPSPTTSDSSSQPQQSQTGELEQQQKPSSNQDQTSTGGSTAANSDTPSPSPSSSTEQQPPRPPDYHQALLMLSQARGDTSITAPMSLPPPKHSPPQVTAQQHHHQLAPPQQQQQPHYEPSPRQRPAHANHGYSDSTLSSGRSSDDGRGSSFMSGGHGRQGSGEGYSSFRGSQEDIHSRNNSHDSSSDYAMSGVSGRSRSSNPHNQPPPLRRGDRIQTSSDNLLSGNSSSSSGGAKRQFANMEYTSGIPTTGNIAFELLKQTQNTKYLLGQNQGQSGGASGGHEPVTTNNPGSASNLSQISEGSSSGSSQYNQRVNNSKEELGPKRKDGRPSKPSMKKGLTEPSTNSPRAQRRNLTGMASEEFLASNLRGVPNQKLSRQIGKADFQEELMRLIDPDLSEKDLVNYSNTRSGPSNRRVGRLQRTLSDESLHNSKGAPIDLNRGMGQNDDSIHQRLSPRAVTDFASARQRSKSTIDNRFVPMLESTAALDWSKLVNVASRAIDDTDVSNKASGKLSESLGNIADEGREDSPPPRPPSPQMSINLSSSPSSLSQSYISMSMSPQQKVQELENRLLKMQQQLEKVNKEKASLESEVQDLRADNVRLQEESHTAATQLRRFTEWFFNTIDRQ